MNECFQEGDEAYRSRRYSAETMARLYNGRFGTDKCDSDFRLGDEATRRLNGVSENDHDDA